MHQQFSASGTHSSLASTYSNTSRPYHPSSASSTPLLRRAEGRARDTTTYDSANIQQDKKCLCGHFECPLVHTLSTWTLLYSLSTWTLFVHVDTFLSMWTLFVHVDTCFLSTWTKVDKKVSTWTKGGRFECPRGMSTWTLPCVEQQTVSEGGLVETGCNRVPRDWIKGSGIKIRLEMGLASRRMVSSRSRQRWSRSRLHRPISLHRHVGGEDRHLRGDLGERRRPVGRWSHEVILRHGRHRVVQPQRERHAVVVAHCQIYRIHLVMDCGDRVVYNLRVDVSFSWLLILSTGRP